MTLLVRGADIIDGSGRPAYRGDLLAVDGVIRQIAPAGGVPRGEAPSGAPDRVVEAAGRVLAPGFIDTHSHSDLKILEDPFVEAKLRQGVTTEILGQDGISLAPLPPAHIDDWRRNLAGLDGTSDQVDWTALGGVRAYFATLERQGLALNAGYLAPHGNLRMEAMGLDDRPASPAELAAMRRAAERELADGALGLSTGLIYIPCAYAPTGELVELCRAVRAAGGVFVTHQRSEANQILSSMDEILRVGAESGCRVHFSHFKVCGRNNWDKIDAVLAKLDAAAAAGVELSFDQYPYAAGSTMLGAILPPWAHAGGGARLLGRLADPAERRRMLADMRAGGSDWDNFVEFAGPEGIYVTSVASAANQDCVGLNLVQIGQARGRDPLEAALDLLLQEENAVGMIDFYGLEEHVARFLARPEQNLCTDGLLGGKPHPRAYGAFPHFLGRFVRELGVVDLPTAVHKMTLKAARAMGIADRGEIALGKAADLVVFDPAVVASPADYQNPTRFPVGIHQVVVNGRVVVDEGRLDRSNRPGRVLRGRP